MPDTYKHGPYGAQQANGDKVAADSQSAIVAIGTAPVQTIEGFADKINTPILVNNMAEARANFGYSDDWASYTLCEVMSYILENRGVGPLILINVLDPAVHKAAEKVSKSLTPENGQVVITNAESAVLDSVLVKAGQTTKVKDTDYSIAYSYTKQTITLTELTPGALGTSALTITYDAVTPASVTDDVVIGTTDDMGRNTGIFALKDVYTKTGVIPAYMIAPGFSSHPAVHSAMYQMSRNISSHWDAWMFTDIPISYISEGEPVAVTLATAYTWKNANGYTKDNETVCFPMFSGIDGKKYHGSVLRAGNFLVELTNNDGVPFHSASNTDCAIIQNLWLGAGNDDRIYDDDIINRYLCKNGITSAAFVGGRWALWGAHSAQYDQVNGDTINVAETNLMMLFYVTNDFQHRRFRDIDEPLSPNDIQQIVAEEQEILDALISMNALLYAKAYMNADEIARSDMYMGDYKFTFDVTTTPLAKSLTALANWVDDGFAVFYNSGASDNG